VVHSALPASLSLVELLAVQLFSGLLVVELIGIFESFSIKKPLFSYAAVRNLHIHPKSPDTVSAILDETLVPEAELMLGYTEIASPES